MKCNYKKQFFFILLFALILIVSGRGGGRGGSGRSSSRGSSSRGSSHSSGGGSSGGGFFSRIFGGSKSSSSSSSSSGSSSSSSSGSSYPKQTYSTGSHSNNNYGSHSNTNYGWNTGGNKYNSGHGHYYNSQSSPTNWGSSGSTYHQQPQNAFGNFHPVSSGIAAPSYHFHRSTSYIPIYIPSSHTYIHRHYTTNNGQSTSTTNNNPPPPPSEPVVYKEDTLSSSYGDSSDTKPTMIVGFNNMIVYGVYENEKHFVITVSEDLDEDADDIPEEFLHMEDSNLFEIVTLKPTTTTTTTTESSNEQATNESGTNGLNLRHQGTSISEFPTSIDKEKMTTNYLRSNDEEQTSGANTDDVLNLYFGDILLR